jgi:8-oxo-dGTP pyrophosphatase MutT (NUDIX family)
MIEPWKLRTERLLQDTRVFRLWERVFVSLRTARAHPFFVIDAPDWVNVVALTPADEVVLVRQYRVGTRRTTLEIPGGMIDAGESPQVAAERELVEESGFRAARWIDLGVIAPNPAILSNRCHTFLAEGCVAGASSPDDGEELEVETRPLAEIPALLADGTIDHALVAVAFQKLDLHRKGLLGR